jgi:hypothetical protein
LANDFHHFFANSWCICVLTSDMKKFNVVSVAKIGGIAFLLVFVLASCGGIKIDTTQTKGVDLKKYKTFAWGDPGDHDPKQTSNGKKKMYTGLIRKLAQAELLKKGFVLDTIQPDAIFVFNSGLEERVEYSQANVNTGYGYDGIGYYSYGYYGGGYYSGGGGGRTSRKEYEEGMLYFDMFDAKTRAILWGGQAKKKLTAKSDVEKDIQKAVKQLFSQLRAKHN